MGYTQGGSPKGGPVFNSTPQTVADLNAGREFTEKLGNRRVGTTSERDAATGNDVWEGLEWYDTTLDALFSYNGSGWDSITRTLHVGGTPLNGPAWDGASPLITKAASETAMPDASSVVTIPWVGGAFPHGLISVVATPGDALTAGKSVINASSTKTHLIMQILTSSGSGVGAATQRVNYVAYGW